MMDDRCIGSVVECAGPARLWPDPCQGISNADCVPGFDWLNTLDYWRDVVVALLPVLMFSGMAVWVVWRFYRGGLR